MFGANFKFLSADFRPHNVKWFYRGALLAVAALTITSQFYLQSVMETQRVDSPRINVSGRQRMLSQKLSKLALMVQRESHVQNLESIRYQIRQIQNEWSTAHTKIFQPRVDEDSKFWQGIRVDLAELELSFKPMLEATHQLIDPNISNAELRTHVDVILKHEDAYLSKMDQIVEKFESHAQGRVDRLISAESAISLIMLGILLMEALFIFEPMHRTLLAKMNALRNAKARAEDLAIVAEKTEHGVLIANENLEIQWVNRAFCELSDYDQTSVKGLHLIDFLELGIIERQKIEKLRDEIHDKPASVHEFYFESRSGKEFWLNGEHQKVVDASGVGEKHIFTLRDRTEARNAEIEHARLRAKLQSAAKQAGKAEAAAEAIHNIGNVINSFRLSVSLLGELVSSKSSEMLARFSQQFLSDRDEFNSFLRQDRSEDRLYQLLKSICDVNERQCFKQEQELISIADNLEHITFIVGKQQSSRSGGNQNEVVDPQSLMLQAIAINTGENSAVDPIVDLQFSDVPEVETSKHEVLQVLVNLIKNSKQAVRHLDIDKQSVTAIIEADESWLRFRVADNGIGVSRQNMRKLFSHGFTTKETGHGFGLSASIETARKLGGDLTCRSDGEGMGATFELKLPVAADDRMSQSIVEDACHV